MCTALAVWSQVGGQSRDLVLEGPRLDQEEKEVVGGSLIWGFSSPVHHQAPVFGQGLFSASASMFSTKAYPAISKL